MAFTWHLKKDPLYRFERYFHEGRISMHLPASSHERVRQGLLKIGTESARTGQGSCPRVLFLILDKKKRHPKFNVTSAATRFSLDKIYRYKRPWQSSCCFWRKVRTKAIIARLSLNGVPTSVSCFRVRGYSGGACWWSIVTLSGHCCSG